MSTQLVLLGYFCDEGCTLRMLPIEIIHIILEVPTWNKLIRLYKSIDQHNHYYWSDLEWSRISQNPNITWDIIQANPEAPWDWRIGEICLNPNITWEIIQANPRYKWNWYVFNRGLKNNKTLTILL